MNTQFGVPGRELSSARRGAGLIKHRRALRRRLAQMNGVDPIVLSLMLDPMHFRWIRKDAARAIAQTPASSSQLPSQSL